MDKRVVLVTGAASGIGRATCLKFFAEGYYVLALDCDGVGLRLLQEEIGEDSCFVRCVDLCNEMQLNLALLECMSKTKGKINTVVANAGVLFQQSFESIKIEDSKKMIDVNATSVVCLIYAMLPFLKQNKNSRLIINTSASAMFGVRNFAVYSATKGFLKNLTESLFLEFKQFNIKVCSVMPFVVSTNIIKNYEQKLKDKIVPNQSAMQIANLVFVANKKMNKLHFVGGFKHQVLLFLKKFLPRKLFLKILDKTMFN